jgi:hypothetical protein
MPERAADLPQPLFLGTGHWSNPGKDYKSIEFDDMLAPGRQREIGDCLERLAGFAPTKVALEVMADATDELNADYQRFRAGNLALTANERHQLGFRFANAMGHDRIYGIDWHDLTREIGWDAAIAFARQHGQHKFIAFFTQLEQEGDEDRAAERDRIRRWSVREQLLETNDSASLADSHRIYMDLAQVGEGSNYIGGDVILRWYERNMKIFLNIARIATSPVDRVLVVIGGGHLPLLTHFAEGSGRFAPVPASRYLG